MAKETGLQALDNEILLSMIEDDEPQGSYEDDLIDKVAQERLLASIDTKSGAPASVRAQVGAAQTPEDKLATLKKFFPDAVPVEILDPEYGAAKFGRGNFVFTNPESGQLSLYDEDFRLFGIPFPSGRDLLDVGPEIAETVGAIGGGIAGGIAGSAVGPVGTAAGVIGGEGLGSAAAREAYINILDFFGETEDTRSGGEQLLDFGTTAAINAAGGPIINKVISGVKYVAGQPLRYATGSLSPEAKVAKERMESVGVTDLTPGQITANPTLNLMEQALAAAPLSTKIMHENATQTINQIDNFAKDLAEKYGGVRTTSEAAEKLVSGARAARLRYDNQVDELYDAVKDKLSPDLRSSATNTAEFAEELMRKAGTATGKSTYTPALRQAEKVLQDAKDGVLDYKTLKDFRSSLMANVRAAESRGALSAKERQMKRLIGYVTKDLDTLVKTSGDEGALELYKKANAFVAKNQGKTGSISYVDNILKKADGRETNALKYVLSGSRDGGEDLLKLKQVLSPEEFSTLSGYMLGKMGTPLPGVATASELGQEALKEGAEYISEQGFSPRTFLSNWNRLSKEAKDALFKGTEYKDLVPALDNLVFTVDRIGKTASQMANPSGTARVTYALGMLGLLGGDIMFGKALGSEGFEYGLGGLIAPYASAKLFTNKQFVNWLTEGAEKAAYDPQSFGQHVRRLYQIYQINPDIREEIRAVAAGLTGDSIEPAEFQEAASSVKAEVLGENEGRFRQVVGGEEIIDKVSPARMQDLAQTVSPLSSTFDIDMFEPLPSLGDDSQFAMSPTVVPSESDREIAMRQMQKRGLGSLV